MIGGILPINQINKRVLNAPDGPLLFYGFIDSVIYIDFVALSPLLVIRLMSETYFIFMSLSFYYHAVVLRGIIVKQYNMKQKK